MDGEGESDPSRFTNTAIFEVHVCDDHIEFQGANVTCMSRMSVVYVRKGLTLPARYLQHLQLSFFPLIS